MTYTPVHHQGVIGLFSFFFGFTFGSSHVVHLYLLPMVVIMLKTVWPNTTVHTLSVCVLIYIFPDGLIATQ